LLVSDFVQKHFVAARNVFQFARARKRHEQQCFRNNVSQFARARKRHEQQCFLVCLELLLMMFLALRKLGNICCGHNVSEQNLCPQQMLRARANGEKFVSATMCPQQCVLVCQGLYTWCMYLKGLGHAILGNFV